MRFYHGSPKILSVLKPQKAHGMNSFENLKGVFLADTFLHAALYAIGKTLNGKTKFGVCENKLVVLGDFDFGGGYVYEVESENLLEGPRRQYLSRKELKPLKKTKVFPKDYEDYIIRVIKKEDILKELE